MSHSNPKASVRALLTEIIDYAGLFPPAQLSMQKAVANYAAYKNNRYQWMLGRFVVPGERLKEFAVSAKNFFSAGGKPWRLSVLGGGDIYQTAHQIQDFNHQYPLQVVC